MLSERGAGGGPLCAPAQPAITGLLDGRTVSREDGPLDQAGRPALALAHVAECGAITVAEHAARCGITSPTASKDLHALVTEGRLVAHGRARGLRFAAAQTP